MIFSAHELWHFLLAALLLGAGTAGDQPVLMSECIRRSPPDQRGRASNTSYLGIDIGGFVGSNLAGLVVSHVGYRRLYLIFMLPVLAATVIYTLYERRKARETALAESGAP